MTGEREFVYTLCIDSEEDPLPEDPEGPQRCAGCGDPIPVGEFYVYKGKSYHEKCLPEPAREVATDVE